MRRTALMFALAGMVGALVATPIAVYATHQFTDVSDSAFFSNSVTWMKDNGITAGCNPPANTKYCPNDNVSRGEMAVFLKRLAEKKIVDAATVDGFSASQLTRVAFGSTGDAADADGDAVSASITIPKDGWLILSGSIEGSGGATDFYNCQLTVDGVTVAGTLRVSRVDDPGGDHTNNAEENCSTTGVHQVTGGSNLVVALNISGRNTAQFLDATVWALYVPFDGQGNRP